MPATCARIFRRARAVGARNCIVRWLPPSMGFHDDHGVLGGTDGQLSTARPQLADTGRRQYVNTTGQLSSMRQAVGQDAARLLPVLAISTRRACGHRATTQRRRIRRRSYASYADPGCQPGTLNLTTTHPTDCTSISDASSQVRRGRFSRTHTRRLHSQDAMGGVQYEPLAEMTLIDQHGQCYVPLDKPCERSLLCFARQPRRSRRHADAGLLSGARKPGLLRTEAVARLGRCS